MTSPSPPCTHLDLEEDLSRLAEEPVKRQHLAVCRVGGAVDAARMVADAASFVSVVLQKPFGLEVSANKAGGVGKSVTVASRVSIARRVQGAIATCINLVVEVKQRTKMLVVGIAGGAKRSVQ